MNLQLPVPQSADFKLKAEGSAQSLPPQLPSCTGGQQDKPELVKIGLKAKARTLAKVSELFGCLAEGVLTKRLVVAKPPAGFRF